ncbi:uncharacterized protein LOC136042388 isoform X2 [Artemia franciscana]|uniref:Uncharacterized protein n=1 Tax=Artemia franciscana TaxID=6661 RepID=A0AA88HRD2_ARTSF|nr:hypothetical protein QYM36_010306 [Artemia franciscana]
MQTYQQEVSNSEDVQLLKQEIDDKEKKILEVEAENHHLKAEIALASFAAEELFQFDDVEPSNVDYNFSSRLHILKNLLFLQALHGISQSTSEDYFKSLILRLSNCSLLPDISYHKLRNLRRRINSDSIDTVLARIANDVTSSSLIGHLEKLGAVRIMAEMADLEDTCRATIITSKLMTIVERMVDRLIESDDIILATDSLILMKHSSKIRLEVVSCILLKIRDLLPSFSQENTLVGSLLGKRCASLIAICEKLLKHDLFCLSSSKQEKSSCDVSSWINILKHKQLQEKMKSECSQVCGTYVNLKMCVDEVAKLVPIFMPLLVVALASCESLLKKSITVVELRYRR